MPLACCCLLCICLHAPCLVLLIRQALHVWHCQYHDFSHCNHPTTLVGILRIPWTVLSSPAEPVCYRLDDYVWHMCGVYMCTPVPDMLACILRQPPYSPTASFGMRMRCTCVLEGSVSLVALAYCQALQPPPMCSCLTTPGYYALCVSPDR